MHSIPFVIPFGYLKIACKIRDEMEQAMVAVGILPQVSQAIAQQHGENSKDYVIRQMAVDSLMSGITETQYKTPEGDTKTTKTPFGVLQDTFDAQGIKRDIETLRKENMKMESDGSLENERIIIELLMEKSKSFKEVYELFTTAIRAEINDQLSNIIGVATTDARPGFNFDIMVLPPPTF